MSLHQDIRQGEIAVTSPAATDAGLVFIGHIETPWSKRSSCPRRGFLDGPICTLVFREPWSIALSGIEAFERLEVLYWLHQSRRDLVLQCPANNGQAYGTFALRSPVRPNPIGTSIVALVRREGARLLVRGLDCLNGTPLLDVKPDRSRFSPIAPPKPGEIQPS